MQKLEKNKLSWQEFKASPQYFDKRSKALNGTKEFLLGLFRFVIIVGILLRCQHVAPSAGLKMV